VLFKFVSTQILKSGVKPTYTESEEQNLGPFPTAKRCNPRPTHPNDGTLEFLKAIIYLRVTIPLVAKFVFDVLELRCSSVLGFFIQIDRGGDA
jgi:hypothetical protein